ncbi:tetratricopeptide (TPR) repeat protein [Caulobacter sp. BE264]|uniref:putative 2OG-Fe(II) oxygenase n=1 Tax=Caulobacter sp. BE264 TaxID=2817724 RepID=UPI0028589ED7|nr:putative 2OG-Fe(II) oxygenase [Caulobacter sp. BE264]MDR7230349.1 tetratricopeptide (TPR) repeat protein [Caulobacter sp. BE264]
MTDLVTNQAWTLIDNGRAADALRLTTGPAALPQASASLLMAHAAALKALGRTDEALAFNRRAVTRAPGDRFSWYNLAATLGDLALDDEAEAAARKTIALGLDVPEVRLVLGKALQGLHRYDEAEATFARALATRPNDAAVHLNLAQLRWMRSGRSGTALAPLDAAIARHPADVTLRTIRSNVLTFAGDHAGADAALEDALARAPGDLTARIAAARAAGAVGDRARMLAHAHEAVRLAPGAPESQTVLCEALLAEGQADAAAQAAEALVVAAPDDQYALVLRNTAWRLTGDARGDLFRDYAALVRTDKLDTPEGWDSLEAFLDALRDRMLDLHDLKTHPLNQSLRGGSQVPSLDRSRDPLVQAFFASARKAVARYVETLGAGEDPIRRRRAPDFAFAGGWSVRLRSEGFHADHVHPRGWISSAFYLDLPGRFDDETTRAGWLRFGRPGCLTQPALEAEHFIRPERGALALFPSCLWHGTQPFTDADHRLTIAFDVVPR